MFDDGCDACDCAANAKAECSLRDPAGNELLVAFIGGGGVVAVLPVPVPHPSQVRNPRHYRPRPPSLSPPLNPKEIQMKRRTALLGLANIGLAAASTSIVRPARAQPATTKIVFCT